MFGLAVTVVPATGSITAVYNPADTGNLNPSDYRLDYDGATSTYSLTRLNDNKLITLTGFPGISANVEGMTITEGVPSPKPGVSSSFLIRPAF